MSNKEKELEWLSEIILPKILENGKLISNYNAANAHTFKLHNIEINFIGTAEAFMLTTCYRATITFEHADVTQTHKLVVKKTPDIPVEIFDSISFQQLFNNEIDFYKRILPEIERFVGNDGFTAPKFYYSDLQRSFGTIILGDFAVQNWRITKECFNISLEHALLAVKYLGNFHGIGYAMKHINPKLFENLISNLMESRYANDEIHPEYDLSIKFSVERILKVTREYQPHVTENYLQQFGSLVNKYVAYGRQRVAPVEPFATLCHGDYLRNNIAFKYDPKNDQQPIDVMMFDFQTLRYSSPMVDLTIFLSLSTFTEVRHKHFDQIFDLYCNQLAKTYEKYTQNKLPTFLNRIELLKEYVRFLPYSINICGSFLMTLVEPDTISIEERLKEVRTYDEIRNDTMTRGGEVFDRELAHQVKEMYDLSVLHGVDIGEGINL